MARVICGSGFIAGRLELAQPHDGEIITNSRSLESFDSPIMIHESNAVVTGASSGIGRAIALAIASADGSICLVGRDKQRLEDVAEAARAAASTALVFRADLSADRAIEDLVRYVKQDFKPLDVLLHCAGVHAIGKSREDAGGSARCSVSNKCSHAICLDSSFAAAIEIPKGSNLADFPGPHWSACPAGAAG
jgi:NAD(P)-dependent dehydrogenase (short-subunit alcohol dehydrogenase family)